MHVRENREKKGLCDDMLPPLQFPAHERKGSFVSSEQQMNEKSNMRGERERERESSTTFSMRKLTNISLFLALAFTGSFPLFLQESQRTDTPQRVSATSEHFEIGFKVSF